MKEVPNTSRPKYRKLTITLFFLNMTIEYRKIWEAIVILVIVLGFVLLLFWLGYAG